MNWNHWPWGDPDASEAVKIHRGWMLTSLGIAFVLGLSLVCSAGLIARGMVVAAAPIAEQMLSANAIEAAEQLAPPAFSPPE